ncbi:MAG: amylo-alpha-1,6-glucosidase [Armatimonadaceae bacterium]
MHPLEAAELMGTGNTPGVPLTDDANPFGNMSRREWLSVNGLGGFASGTVAGANTRRYHALLVSALPPPYGRMTLLSKVEDAITLQDERYELSSNRYAKGEVYPEGWRFITEFSAHPVPTWTYRIPGEAVLIKRIFMARGKNTVYITYTLREAPSPATLHLTPLVCWKSYHSEMRPWGAFPVQRGPEVAGWSVQATPDAPLLRLLARGSRWTPAGWWNERIVHDREQERGMEFTEDLFCPATCTLTLRVGETVALVGTIESGEPEDATLALAAVVKHQEALFKAAGVGEKDDERRALLVNADQFLIRAAGVRPTVIAGYPWFTDWGRDTMISLPGLCLATGRHDVAREILQSFAGHVSEGMIPNRFPDAGEDPDYNTVDATLWFVHACDQYRQAVKDKAFTEMLLPVLETIVEWHQRGTRYGIRMDEEDGLLLSGGPGVQLTWMDARVGDWVVTPRSGKPVEIAALWINALRILADWKGKRNGKALTALADQASESFRRKFVRPDGRGLYDSLDRHGNPDATVRPNQVIAAALPHTPLTTAEIKSVVEVTTGELLTPYGLRTLSPTDSRYQGCYFGSPRERDGAYHQGTVWPWLLGPFVDAYRKVHGADADVRAFLDPVIENLRYYGVGGIAEVFDGDPPHHPNGCPWQAWSVAEILRVL